MYGHLVTSVGIAGYAKISSAVVASSADEAQDARYSVGGVDLLDHVSVIGHRRFKLRVSFTPDQLQGVVTLGLALQLRVRAQPGSVIRVFRCKVGRSWKLILFDVFLEAGL